MRRRFRRSDGGFTLIELLITVVIIGVITAPLGNFVIAYFQNLADTQDRLSDSHDIQIASAYFSRDVANLGVRPSMTSIDFQQSVWVNDAPAPCAPELGNAVLLLEWGDPQDATHIHSVGYVAESDGALHRVYCAPGSGEAADIPVVHNLRSASVPPCAPVACESAPPPSTVRLTLQIATGPNDRAAPAEPVTLTGQRRPS